MLSALKLDTCAAPATGPQIRAGRALLGWTRETLAAAAGLHINSVAYWETQRLITHRERQGLRAGPRLIVAALSRNGVELFVHPSPGVRLCVGHNFQAP